MKYILAQDIGYGDNKCCLMSETGEILKIFKFPSLVGITKKNELKLHKLLISCYNQLVHQDKLKGFNT